MAKYLLDTNIISYLESKSSPFHNRVKQNISQLSDNDSVYTSLFSFCEIEYGIAVSDPSESKQLFKNVKKSIQSNFDIMPFTEDCTRIFGELKAAYKKKTGITKSAVKYHNIDFIIAGIAITHEAILVSNDKIFEKLKEIRKDFQLESWT